MVFPGLPFCFFAAQAFLVSSKRNLGYRQPETRPKKPLVRAPPTGQVYEKMSCCCSLGWLPRGASAAHPQKSRHHRHCPPPEPRRPLLPKQHQHHPTMSFYGQRRADNRRNNSTQQTSNPVIEKSVDGGDDDDGRSTTKVFKKRYEIAIPTRNLRWTNLAKYLELEFKELGVQVPKDQKVRHSSGCVCLRHQWHRAACARAGVVASAAQLLTHRHFRRRSRCSTSILW